MPVLGMPGLDGRSACRNPVGTRQNGTSPKGGRSQKKGVRYSKAPVDSLLGDAVDELQVEGIATCKVVQGDSCKADRQQLMGDVTAPIRKLTAENRCEPQ